MPRLPVPGEDDGSWGSILNDYLLTAHEADGTLRSDMVSADTIQDDSITATKLASGAGSDGNVLTKDTASGGGFVWSSPAATPDATSIAKGVVQLAGDLSGTAAAPTVPALAAKEDTSNKGIASGYAGLDSGAKVPNTQLPVARTPVQLTDASTIATDASLGTHFYVTLAASRILGAPTNPQDGQRVMWEFIQGGAGSNTITLDSVFGLGADISNIVLTTTVGKRDYMGAVYNQAVNKWFVIAFVRGY